MNEKTNGLLMIVLAIVLVILYIAIPNWIDWIYGIIVAILLGYGLYLYFSK
ncbi:pilus assembly FimT family protein [Methanobacterium petrolearium]|uniref:pilus assembly FimT family protein n=1 Tax=Methanobacterium petrolearium TaxID=710190 RepID=UPI001AE247C6|nr:hypothetical protein [Methanobacterium petrolearium]MBP1946360.1 high-affinity Fe2+/Pb2+ permease [Methanobacterium petrolearium]